MKNAVLIHGYNDESEFLDPKKPAASNDHWFPWLQRQLLMQKIETQTPEMPGFYEPNYDRWKATLDALQPNKDTILVGHSCGGGFLVRWLSETKQQVDTVVLVAPWLDPEKRIDPEFFAFTIDPTIVNLASKFVVMYSTDDMPDVLKSVDIIKEHIPDATYMEFNDKGHFCLGDLHSPEFPELLELLQD